MSKTYLTLRDLLNARSHKNAHFLVEEAIFGRAADNKTTWCTCAVPAWECRLASAYESVDVSNGANALGMRSPTLVEIFVASLWRQSAPGCF